MIPLSAIGNLVTDPKLITLKDDFKIVEARLAVTKSKEKTIFIDVKFKNNKAGEILLQHAKKGSGVFIWGVLDEEVWGSGDAKKSKMVIEADGFRFNGGGKSENSGEQKKGAAPKSNEPDNDEPPF